MGLGMGVDASKPALPLCHGHLSDFAFPPCDLGVEPLVPGSPGRTRDRACLSPVGNFLSPKRPALS